MITAPFFLGNTSHLSFPLYILWHYLSQFLMSSQPDSHYHLFFLHETISFQIPHSNLTFAVSKLLKELAKAFKQKPFISSFDSLRFFITSYVKSKLHYLVFKTAKKFFSFLEGFSYLVGFYISLKSYIL